MSYEDKVICKKDKCDGEITVPIKLLIRGSGVVDVARCPKCHKSYKFLLPDDDRDLWLPVIAERIFDCDNCGSDNSDNFEYAGSSMDFKGLMSHPYYYWTSMSQNVKTMIKCWKCGKKRTKVVSDDMWSELSKLAEKIKASPPPSNLAGELKCPKCDAEISEDMQACPNCETALVCDKCKAPIAPSAKFCSHCGDKVTKIDVSVKGEVGDTCPSCQEPYSQGAAFCAVCGQELLCDKCGTKIREGAAFCTYCGDPVVKGELSL